MHAQERARERCGIDLSRDDMLGIAQKIRSGQGIRLRDRDSGGFQVLVTWNAKAMRVVFRPDLCDPLSILTVLPSPGHRDAEQKAKLRARKRSRPRFALTDE